MKIALADCSERHEGVETERPFWEALAARGVRFERPDWEDEAVDWASFDLVVVRTTWTYHRKLGRFLDWIQRVAGVSRLLNAPEVLAWNAQKSYLKDLAAGGVPVAPTVWLEPSESTTLSSVMSQRGWSSGLLKPLVGAVASDTCRFDLSEPSLRGAEEFLRARLGSQEMMLQPYLSRVEVDGEVSVMLIDGEPTHSVQKLAVAGDYRVQDAHGGTDHLVELDPVLVEISKRALSVAPGEEPPLYARVDFLFDEEGAAVVNELELIEPMLFFQHCHEAAEVFADALCSLRS